MTTASQIKALIRSHSEGDEEQFFSMAMQVAAQAARHGKNKFGQELRDLVDQARGRTKERSGQRTRRVPLVQPRGELAGTLMVAYPKGRLSEMALSEGVRSR